MNPQRLARMVFQSYCANGGDPIRRLEDLAYTYCYTGAMLETALESLKGLLPAVFCDLAY